MPQLLLLGVMEGRIRLKGRTEQAQQAGEAGTQPPHARRQGKSGARQLGCSEYPCT